MATSQKNINGVPTTIAIPLEIVIYFLNFLQYVAINSPLGSSSSSHLAQASKYSNMEFLYPILRTAFLELTMLYYTIPIAFRQDYIAVEKSSRLKQSLQKRESND